MTPVRRAAVHAVPGGQPFFPSDPENCYGWLIQFADGNRLDLHVCTLKSELKNLETDHMYRVLMDKDGCLPVLNTRRTVISG